MDYYVDNSKIHGKGIFAGRNYNVNEDIGHLVNVVSKKVNGKEYFTSSMSASLNTFLERSQLERYLNHSLTPNAECKVIGTEVKLFSIKPIKKGEEITVNYSDAYKKLDIAQIIYKRHNILNK